MLKTLIATFALVGAVGAASADTLVDPATGATFGTACFWRMVRPTHATCLARHWHRSPPVVQAASVCPQPTAELDAAVCPPHVVKTVRVRPEEMPTAMLPTLPVMYTDGPFMSAYDADETVGQENNIGLVNDLVVPHERTPQG